MATALGRSPAARRCGGGGGSSSSGRAARRGGSGAPRPCAAPVTIEPHVDASVLGAQLAVLATTAGLAAVWWRDVVPSARRSLAKEKHSGPSREYLEQLQASPQDRPLQAWFYTDWLRQLQQRQDLAVRGAAKRAAVTAAATASAATAADVQPAEAAAAESAPSQQPQPVGQPEQAPPLAAGAAADEDREPSFWSLDNPLVATAAMLGAVALVSVLTRWPQ